MDVQLTIGNIFELYVLSSIDQLLSLCDMTAKLPNSYLTALHFIDPCYFTLIDAKYSKFGIFH